MEKRKITLGEYDTAANGWTLTKWKLSAAEQKTNFIDRPGGDGSWDLSTALTDGVPRYKDRTFTATLECSEGDRLTRKALIREMINQVDGVRAPIVLPDDPDAYVVGRLHIAEDYNDLAHAAVKVTATCEPWLYNKATTSRTLTATSTEKSVTLPNAGRLVVVPTLEVTGSVRLVCGAASKTFSAGTYQWPELAIAPGGQVLTYSGSGTAVITYREAVL